MDSGNSAAGGPGVPEDKSTRAGLWRGVFALVKRVLAIQQSNLGRQPLGSGKILLSPFNSSFLGLFFGGTIGPR